jgi:protein-tyrosine phosphatase/arsenate reductase
MKQFLFPQIQTYCADRISEFDLIPAERKIILQRIADYIRNKRDENQFIQLVYICTHNSRRSHFGQIWGAVAAAYFDVPTAITYSGGTEATQMHPNVLSSLERTGFVVEKNEYPSNPLYEVNFGTDLSTTCFSKEYNDKSNPQNNFAAIMVCSDAEENCPFIPNVELRVAITYKDPKAFDKTPQQDASYDERSAQIAREILYMFSLV